MGLIQIPGSALGSSPSVTLGILPAAQCQALPSVTMHYVLIDLRKYKEVTEAQIIEINMTNGSKILFCSVYRSPNSSLQNDNDLNELVCTLANANHGTLILAGDFNYPCIDWNLLTNTSQSIDKHFTFVETVKDSFLTQHIYLPTRGRGTDRPSLLDLLLTDMECPEPSIEMCAPLGKSDHSLIKANFDLSIIREDYCRERYNYDKGNYEELRRELNINWTETLSSLTDLEEIWACIKGKILAAEKNHIPLRPPKKRQRNHTVPLEWSIRKAIKKRKRRWKRFTQEGNTEVYRDYCKIRNRIRKETRNKKKCHEQRIASQVATNPKCFWAYANSRTKCREDIPNLFRNNDPASSHFTSNEQEKVNLLGDFFSSVFTIEPPDQSEDLPDIYPVLTDDVQITEDEVLKKLSEIKPDKSPGTDGIHP